ncbi:Rad4-domain-containing protein [Durotheca rogersii]|uniref:Rad4-domain-containing protein n=1 Tax=Durotheca rogersii TaxID=419775 RepID=UPI00221E7157|nr:Rad4-domain-containing protein [Durotheca rogersii]KAI5866699.1 Rad4-domain-containing protein [Durotheca rogersii]
MPPHVPHKRLRTPSPDSSNRVTRQSRRGKDKPQAGTSVPSRKATLFDDLDTGSKIGSAEKTKSAMQQMHEDVASDDSSLSSLSDADFESMPNPKPQKVNHDSDESEDEDVVFEDVPSHEPQQLEPEVDGDLELTLYQNNHVPMTNELGKRGPSKKEKAIRMSTHCMHVQFLLWHNAVRNSWCCDQEVQAIMISHLPPRLWDEVDRWRRNSGLDVLGDVITPSEVKTSSRGGNRRGKGKLPPTKPTRDWGSAADRLEKGVPDLSHGDPLFRLMNCLVSWWKQRFRITAPGLRKWGYMDVRRLGKLRSNFEEEEHDPDRFGERVVSLEEFRRHAQDCVGSRDVGSQLFTALLRGLGLQTRLVASIQPLGFGWSKIEEADEENQDGKAQKNARKSTGSSNPANGKKMPLVRPAIRRARTGDNDTLKMDLDDSDEYEEPLMNESDDESVIDITETLSSRRPEAKLYDKDLEFPHYWSEVLSPVTKRFLPVDPIVKSIVATSRDLVESLEPRGGKADKAKQVMAYCIGFSQDGTAKDVTVRYLKKNIFPGKTKGFRIPEQKIPVYNKHGKVKRYDQFDWFRAAMRGYIRGDRKHPITDVDEEEDSTDLKPSKPEKKEVKEGEETLQYYKTSRQYVLERHLKREEALLPTAVAVKLFRNKGKGSKTEGENVYLRKDVVTVKSAETWHKQGRAPIEGVQPLKHAPYRAATTNRRREIAEAEAATGQKVMQPLYSFDQTNWIIPPPIQDGIIPKNEYGNIDMFAEHMCPEGAVHVPYRGVVRVCKRLQIDYAEAVVGFEFGHRMAVPVIQGAVIAEEYYERVFEELKKDEAERKRKENEKRRKEVLTTWRKFLMGLRVVDRFRQEHGYLEEPVDAFGHDDVADDDFRVMRTRDEEMAGGFLPEGHEEEEGEEDTANADERPRETSGFFPAAEEDDSDDGNDPFEVDYGKHAEAEAQLAEEPPKPEPIPTAAPKKAVPKPKAKPKQTVRRRSRRKKAASSDEGDEDDDDFEISDSE